MFEDTFPHGTVRVIILTYPWGPSNEFLQHIFMENEKNIEPDTEYIKREDSSNFRIFQIRCDENNFVNRI